MMPMLFKNMSVQFLNLIASLAWKSSSIRVDAVGFEAEDKRIHEIGSYVNTFSSKNGQNDFDIN